MQRLGEESGDVARRHGRVAEGAGDVAVPRADLQLTRHHGADAGRRAPVHDGGQELERRNEAGPVRPTRARSPRHRQDTRQAAQVKRAP